MRVTLCLLACVLLAVGSAGAQTLVTFEEFVGFDGSPLSTFYAGINFIGAATGEQWIAADASGGDYNISLWDCANEMDLGIVYNEGSYWICDQAAAWTGATGDDGLIEFDNQDATFVEVRYCAATPIYVDAYDSSGVLLTSAVGDANLRDFNAPENGPGTLLVEAPPGEYIGHVIIHDSGNFWVIDNLRTDASGITTSYVSIDIKPGSDPNCFNNNGHGLVTVAVLGTADFDVTQIDAWSLLFGGLAVNVKGDDSPHCAYEDVSGDPPGDPDGYTDLVCHFVDAEGFEWDAEAGTADLLGSLQAQFGGTAFIGTDTICMVPPE